MERIVLETDVEGAKLLFRGKVRDMYDLGDRLVIVATDRISAFDSILPSGIPYKGAVLTQLSRYWFDLMSGITKNHMLSVELSDFPEEFREERKILEGRSMLVRKTERIDVECVVRGYLAGSGWDEYQEKGEVCAVKLPAGLVLSDRLPEPIFTPAIKSDTGHDINVSSAEVAKRIGRDLTSELEEKSLRIYEKAARHAESKGLIIADTKFEFGILEGEVILIDEALTPDSSRFWAIDCYTPGVSQPSFDKQFVRDYLTEIGWDREPPAPKLPGEVVEKTSEKYLEAYRRITGESLRLNF